VVQIAGLAAADPASFSASVARYQKNPIKPGIIVGTAAAKHSPTDQKGSVRHG
jgi:hypothetical protein